MEIPEASFGREFPIPFNAFSRKPGRKGLIDMVRRHGFSVCPGTQPLLTLPTKCMQVEDLAERLYVREGATAAAPASSSSSSSAAATPLPARERAALLKRVQGEIRGLVKDGATQAAGAVCDSICRILLKHPQLGVREKRAPAPPIVTGAGRGPSTRSRGERELPSSGSSGAAGPSVVRRPRDESSGYSSADGEEARPGKRARRENEDVSSSSEAGEWVRERAVVRLCVVGLEW